MKWFEAIWSVLKRLLFSFVATALFGVFWLRAMQFDPLYLPGWKALYTRYVTDSMYANETMGLLITGGVFLFCLLFYQTLENINDAAAKRIQKTTKNLLEKPVLDSADSGSKAHKKEKKAKPKKEKKAKAPAATTPALTEKEYTQIDIQNLDPFVEASSSHPDALAYENASYEPGFIETNYALDVQNSADAGAEAADDNDAVLDYLMSHADPDIAVSPDSVSLPAQDGMVQNDGTPAMARQVVAGDVAYPDDVLSVMPNLLGVVDTIRSFWVNKGIPEDQLAEDPVRLEDFMEMMLREWVGVPEGLRRAYLSSFEAFQETVHKVSALIATPEGQPDATWYVHFSERIQATGWDEPVSPYAAQLVNPSVLADLATLLEEAEAMRHDYEELRKEMARQFGDLRQALRKDFEHVQGGTAPTAPQHAAVPASFDAFTAQHVVEFGARIGQAIANHGSGPVVPESLPQGDADFTPLRKKVAGFITQVLQGMPQNWVFQYDVPVIDGYLAHQDVIAKTGATTVYFNVFDLGGENWFFRPDTGTDILHSESGRRVRFSAAQMATLAHSWYLSLGVGVRNWFGMPMFVNGTLDEDVLDHLTPMDHMSDEGQRRVVVPVTLGGQGAPKVAGLEGFESTLVHMLSMVDLFDLDMPQPAGMENAIYQNLAGV